ncbi:PKD domain-containing protein [Deinococcus sp.]|uniref:PKD domain-containing protein n=1 Tax=Deinococcus sp. TaxID=47478 RepID=UPI0025D23432|nr:PKD domain-containing protein [Deinococcus sp.]
MNALRTAALLLTAALGLASCNDPVPVVNAKPVVEFTVTPTSGVAPVNVITTNTSSDADAGDTLTSDWSWGDGTANSTDKTPTHSYTKAGTYTVTLKVSDGKDPVSKTATVTVTDPPPAPTVPKVLSVTPTDGAAGVLDNAVITVTFSVPMDVATVAAAYTSTFTGVKPGDVNLAWTANNTVLTITPKAALSYNTVNTVATPVASKPTEYGFSIGTGARSSGTTAVPGVALAAEFKSGFKTAIKHAGIALYSDPARDLSVNSLGLSGTFGQAVIGTSPDLAIGDDATNKTLVGYLTFDLSSLPATLSAANLVAADLTLSPSATPIVGTPYTALNVGPSKLNIRSLYYGANLKLGDLNPTTEVAGNLDGTLMTANALNAVKADVTARTAQNNVSQYQIRFPNLTNNNNAADQIFIFSSATANALNRPRLTVTYFSDN